MSRTSCMALKMLEAREKSKFGIFGVRRQSAASTALFERRYAHSVMYKRYDTPKAASTLRRSAGGLQNQFTTFWGLPARKARTFSTAICIRRARAARVAHAW